MKDCPFCNRIKNQQVDYAYVGGVVHFKPLNPVVPMHRLFVPSQHVEHDYMTAPMAVATAMQAAERWGRSRKENFNLIISSGAAATQTVDHLHVHYIPRRKGDGLLLPWTNQTVKMEEETNGSNSLY